MPTTAPAPDHLHNLKFPHITENSFLSPLFKCCIFVLQNSVWMLTTGQNADGDMKNKYSLRISLVAVHFLNYLNKFGQ